MLSGDVHNNMLKLESLIRILCALRLLAFHASSSTAGAAAAAVDTDVSTQRDLDTRPNIIFILAEDMGLGDLACYGHPYARTPNLDRLAAEGTRFSRFYVAGATCNPSRTGFMSSRNPPTIPNCECGCSNVHIMLLNVREGWQKNNRRVI